MDIFLSKKVKEAGPEFRYRARSLVAINLILSGIYAFLLTYHYLHGRMDLPSLFLVLIGQLGSLIVLRWTSRINLAGNILIGVVNLSVLFVIWHRGGMDAPGLIWAGIVPIFSGLFLDFAWTMMWSGFGVTVLTIVYYLQSHGSLIYMDMPTQQLWQVKLSAFIFVQIIGAFTLARFRSVMLRQRQEIEAEKSETETLLRVLCHDLNPSLEVLGKFIGQVDEQTSQVSLARSALINIREIVAQARDWERVGQSIAEPLVLQSVGVNTVMHALYGRFIVQIEAKKIQFEFQRGSGINASVLAEPTFLIHQILGNLMSNAIKFTPVGGRIILRATKNGNQIDFLVADNGVGMPSTNVISRNPKEGQLRAGTQGEIGTGFGLPIVANYVERLRGKIRFKSAEKRAGLSRHGTVVRVSLKASSGGAVEPVLEQKALFLRVLVIDDSEIYHEMAKEILSKLYCVCSCVTNSQSALAALREQKFDAIFVDAHLSGESGYLLAKEIRRNSYRGSARVFYFSASAPRPEEKPLSFEEVFDGYVLKPLDFVQLQSVLGPLSDQRPVVDPIFFERFSINTSDREGDLLKSLSRTFLGSVESDLQAVEEGVRRCDAASAKKRLKNIRIGAESLGLLKIARIASYLENEELERWAKQGWLLMFLRQEVSGAREFLSAQQAYQGESRI